MNARVYIITWCQHPDALYGATLTFKTLRVGFPSFPVTVIDNGSIPEVRAKLQKGADSCGADYLQIHASKPHDKVLEIVLGTAQKERGAIFVDPDLCFWQSVEDWRLDGLLAGRLIPRFPCSISGCITHPRLHTSLLWVSDVGALQNRIVDLRRNRFEFHPWQPMMLSIDGSWHRWDTGAALTDALGKDAVAFSQAQLECYDHLFCGTHASVVADSLPPEFSELHAAVRRDHRALRGAWKLQERYFVDVQEKQNAVRLAA